MRIRSIKPGWWTDRDVRNLPVTERLLLLGLKNFCDDEGRCELDYDVIKGAIFPSDKVNVEKGIECLRKAGKVVTYSENGNKYLAVPNWTDEQKVNRPYRSKYPPPNDNEPMKPPEEHTVNAQGILSDDSLLVIGVRGKGLGNRGKGSAWSADEIEQIYQAYPKKRNKLDALKAIPKALDQLKKFGESDPVSFLLARTQQEAVAKESKDEQYIAYPAKWFNGGDYLEPPEQPSSASNDVETFIAGLRRPTEEK